MNKVSYPRGPKMEWQKQADSIARGNIKINDSDLPKLIEWLQDMNWPGASTISTYLKGRGKSTIEPVRKALQSEDNMWNYWILEQFGDNFDRDYWLKLKNELISIASYPDEDAAHIEALYIITRYHLLPKEEIQSILNRVKANAKIDHEEYLKVERVLADP